MQRLQELRTLVTSAFVQLAITGQISAKSIALSKVMSLEELEALEAKMVATNGSGADGESD